MLYMTYHLVNGSPRKKSSTAKLLDAIAEGITDTDEDAEVEIIDLYDLDYKGCKSCFHCKRIDGKFYGTCPIKDDLNGLLPELWDSDALVIASPIYFGNITGEARSFIERLVFPKLVYGGKSLLDSKPTAMVYTMNAKKEIADEIYSKSIFESVEGIMNYAFGSVESLKVYDTYQFNDYSLYENYIFDEKDKRRVLEEEFPKDLERAYNLGVKLGEV